MAQKAVLNLDTLAEAIPGLSAALAQTMYEAAVMCLELHWHESGVSCKVRGLANALAETEVRWTGRFSDRIRRTFGDTTFAVEMAAEGLACLTIRELTDYIVIERAVRGDGIDFWLALREREADHTRERAASMECKGIFEARFESDIAYRLRQGLRQSERSGYTNLPAFVIVSEFSNPVIYMVAR